MRLGTGELLMILLIVMLVFGASRVAELGKGLGLGMRSFRDALKGHDGHYGPDGHGGPDGVPGGGDKKPPDARA